MSFLLVLKIWTFSPPLFPLFLSRDVILVSSLRSATTHEDPTTPVKWQPRTSPRSIFTGRHWSWGGSLALNWNTSVFIFLGWTHKFLLLVSSTPSVCSETSVSLTIPLLYCTYPTACLRHLSLVFSPTFIPHFGPRRPECMVPEGNSPRCKIGR